MIQSAIFRMIRIIKPSSSKAAKLQISMQQRFDVSWSSNVCRNSRALTAFDFFVFSVTMRKFFICGTVISLYS